MTQYSVEIVVLSIQCLTFRFHSLCSMLFFASCFDCFQSFFSPSPCHIRLRVCWVVVFLLLFMENLRSPPEGGPLSCLRETQDNNSAQNLMRTHPPASPRTTNREVPSGDSACSLSFLRPLRRHPRRCSAVGSARSPPREAGRAFDVSAPFARSLSPPRRDPFCVWQGPLFW